MAERFGRGDQWKTPVPRSGIVDQIKRDAPKFARSRGQVLLCFTGDPYCREETNSDITRAVLPILLNNKIPVAILTKGGKRCLRDLDIFRRFGRSIKVGATLTFADTDKSREWEPGAALPEDRFAALWQLHRAGIATWASLEPIIDPAETLEIIRETTPYIDHYKLGRWNHDQRADQNDYAGFLAKAIPLLRDLGKPLYVKECLRPYAPRARIRLTAEETDPDALCLPPFPAVARADQLALSLS